MSLKALSIKTFSFLAVACIVFLVIRAPKVSALEDLMFEEIPLIISSSQLYQSRAQSPASVATVDGDDIELHNFTSIEESLIVFPGMMVASLTPTISAVSYKGESLSRNFRLGILVDSVSPNLRSVLSNGSNLSPDLSWHLLPVMLEEVERIEGVMSPSAAVYGSEAFQAAINILTKDPSQTQGQLGKYFRSSEGLNRYYFRHGGQSGDTFFRLSFVNQTYNTPEAKAITDPELIELPDLAADIRNENTDHTFENTKVILNSTTALSDSLDLKINAGHININNVSHERRSKSYTKEGDLFAKIMQFQSKEDSTSDFLNIVTTKTLSPTHNLEFRTSYNQINYEQNPIQCLTSGLVTENAGPVYQKYFLGEDSTGWRDIIAANINEPDMKAYAIELGIVGDSSRCGYTNNDLDQEQWSIGVKDTWAMTDNIRSVTTLNLAHNQYDSLRLYGGETKYNDIEFYTNLEYRPSSKLTINTGLQLSYASHQDSSVEPSSRIAINYHLTPDHTIRISKSRGKWLHKLENLIDFQATLQFANNTDGRTEGDISVANKIEEPFEPETNDNVEIGYYGQSPNRKQNWDIRIYHETQKNLIPTLANIIFGYTNNQGELKQTGIETQLTYWFGQNFHIAMSSFYVDAELKNHFDEDPFSSYGGGAMAEWRFWQDCSLGLSYHGSHGNESRSSLDRSAVNIRKSYGFHNGSKLNISLGVRHTGEVDFQQDSPSVTFTASNEEATSYYTSLSLAF